MQVEGAGERRTRALAGTCSRSGLSSRPAPGAAARPPPHGEPTSLSFDFNYFLRKPVPLPAPCTYVLNEFL